MSNSGLDLMILLLDSMNDHRVSGRLRFHKFLFLMIKEGNFQNFEREFHFEPYKFGPWSSVIDSYFQLLEDKKIITIHEEILEEPEDFCEWTDSEKREFIRKTYILSEKGIDIAEKLKDYYKKKLSKFSLIAANFSSITNENLVSYIYTKYPHYSSKSDIKENVKTLSPQEEFNLTFPNDEINDDLFSIVGIISKIPLEKEKRIIKEIIMERY